MNGGTTMTEFEKLGGTYRQAGDYFLPNLKISDPIGWGRRNNNIRNRAVEIVNEEIIFA